MPGLLSDVFSILAQAAPAVAPGKGDANPYIQFLPFLPALFIIYFLLIRPPQQQEKQRREMLGKLKKNDKVLTAAGMYGTVISVDEEGDRVQVRLDDDGKVKVTFTRASIVRILNETPAKPAEAK